MRTAAPAVRNTTVIGHAVHCLWYQKFLLNIFPLFFFSKCKVKLCIIFAQAVCCEDHVHCCPHDTVCNLSEGTCDNSVGLLLSVPLVKKLPASPRSSQPADEKCDQTFSCTRDTTCCKTASGTWGCCPLPQVGARVYTNAVINVMLLYVSDSEFYNIIYIINIDFMSFCI